MTEITHRTVEANGIRMHFAEAGEGPLVLLCHGFPEILVFLAASADGARGGRFPRRGAGHARLRPDRPARRRSSSTRSCISSATWSASSTRSVPSTAVIAGHDWGAPVAWHAALLRPDRFRGVIGLERAVPAAQRCPADQRDAADRPASSISSISRRPAWPRRNWSATRAALRASSTRFRATRRAGRIAARGAGMVPRTGGFLSRLDPPALPAWLTEADLDFYAGEFARDRISRRPQLVSQHRSQLGAAGALCRDAGDGSGALHRRRPRSRHGVPRHGPADRQSHEFRAGTARARSSCRAAATGPSRSARPKSTLR